ADLKNLDETKRAYDKAVNAVAVPDVLINNAGIFPGRASLEELTPELWNSTFDINLRAAYYLSKIFSDKAESGSSIVNIASLGAEKIWDRRIAYNVSKSALVQLTKAMARDLAPRIRVNSVSPGSILIHEKDSAQRSDIRTDRIPMQRQGRISDIFETVYFLTNASYINGVNINVDGGLHLI
nr:SDR family oxidoreductase [Candidatus Kapabacteria bacterium]